jgi:hypothetical protein
MRDMNFFMRRYAPVTTHMAFVEMPADDFAKAFLAWRQEINTLFEFDWQEGVKPVKGNLAKKLDALLPLAAGPQTKHLISSTQSKWTVYIPNGAGGGDVHSPTRHMTRILGLRSVTVVLTADEAGRPGSTQFTVQDAREGELQVRAVAAHKESKWEFHEHGTRLPFEQVEKYASRRIKDRLTPELVEQYCGHLGIELFDPDFYAGEGCIIESFPAPSTTFKSHYPHQTTG